jgi:Protein kinase domain
MPQLTKLKTSTFSKAVAAPAPPKQSKSKSKSKSKSPPAPPPAPPPPPSPVVSTPRALRIIGEGTYGCIVQPALTCADEAPAAVEGLVAKVLTPEEANKEMKEAARLTAIDVLVSPAGSANTRAARYKYGVYALGTCAFSQDNAGETRAWTAAVAGRVLKRSTTKCGNVARTALVHMEAAQGDCVVLQRIVHHTLSTRSTDTAHVRPWLNAMKNVLLGLANMHAHGFFHFDVKSENMLWFGATPGSGSIPVPTEAKLTDFGMACTITDRAALLRAPPLLQPWYNYPPLATSMFSYIVFRRDAAANDACAKASALYWTNPRKGAPWIPAFADRRPFTPATLNAYARGVLHSAGRSLGVNPYDNTDRTNQLLLSHLCAAIDLFGFAGAIAPLYYAGPGLEHGRAETWDLFAKKIKTFFDQSACMLLSDAEAIVALDEIIALA